MHTNFLFLLHHSSDCKKSQIFIVVWTALTSVCLNRWLSVDICVFVLYSQSSAQRCCVWVVYCQRVFWCVCWAALWDVGAALSRNVLHQSISATLSEDCMTSARCVWPFPSPLTTYRVTQCVGAWILTYTFALLCWYEWSLTLLFLLLGALITPGQSLG